MVALLCRLAQAGVPERDLFVVTPFVIVAQRLRDRIKASGVLQGWTADPSRWTKDRIGTVQIVQAREADSVIFVLGAPLHTHQGARGWAGGSPNILNVDATRAQENLHVVGARTAWQEAGVCRHHAQDWRASSTARTDAV